MQTLSKLEIENVALKVASILRSRVEGGYFTDPFEPHTWLDACEGICSVHVRADKQKECGLCMAIPATDNEPQTDILVYVQGASNRRSHIARNLLHELTHAVLWHFAPEVFTETTWLMVENPYQATENICRAVERYFLGTFGRGWLPAHGFY